MRRLALALVPILLLPILGVRALPSIAVAATDPAILSEAQGRCPLNLDKYRGKLSDVCTETRRSNGETPDFDTPTQEFGIAYAFNCGPKRRTFRMALGLPGADLGVTRSSVWVKKRTGRGVKMITEELLSEIGALQYPNWSNVMDVELKTDCAWHVVVVQGDEASTRAHVPPVPQFLPYSAYTG